MAGETRTFRRRVLFADWDSAIREDIERSHAEALDMDKARDKAIRYRAAYLANPGKVNIRARQDGCADIGTVAAYVESMPRSVLTKLTKE